MKRVIIIVIGIAISLYALVAGFFWLHDRSCYKNTLYSERFTEQTFAHITVGMPRASVIETLGEPLESQINKRSPVWALRDEATRNRYGKDNQIPLEYLMFSRPKDRYHDFNCVSVTIGPDKTVVESSSYITE